MTDKEYQRDLKRTQKKELRDKFAIGALQGLIYARSTTNRLTEGEVLQISEDAYLVAAAMLKARP